MTSTAGWDRDWSLDQDGRVLFKRPRLFSYTPLAKGEIRLLKFRSGNIFPLVLDEAIGYKPTTEQLNTVLTPCELICTSIEDAPPYVALSYAWGDPSPTHHIILDNFPFPVAKNLFNFFAQVGEHYLNNDLLLWIDAISIDQLNFEERSEQVLQMAKIYDSAYQVHAWLGPGTSNTILAIQKVSSMYKEVESLASESGDVAAAFAQVTPRNPAFFDSSDPRDFENWKSIFEILDRPWWTRAWVVQEATSKPELWIMCGGVRILATAFDVTMGVLRELNRYPEWVQTMGKGHYDNILTLYELKSKRQDGKLSLLEALSGFYKYGCSEPRDKVYAGLGLAYDVGNLLTPDYRRPIHEVYGDVVTHSLLYGYPYHSLDFLGTVLLQEEPIENPIATWIPDWRRTRNLRPFGKKFHPSAEARNQNPGSLLIGSGWKSDKNGATKDSSRRVYAASGTSHPYVRIDGTSMHIKGFQFDIVNIVMYPDRNMEDRNFVKDWVPRNLPPEIDDTYYLTGEKFEHAYLRTLTADIATVDAQPIKRGQSVGDWVFENDWDNVDDVVESRARHRVFGTMKYATHHRRMIFSKKGFIGIGPAAAREGDILCVFYGGQVLYVVRKKEGLEEFEFIGECYVHGLMDGVLMKGCGNGWMCYPEREFILV